MEGSSMRLQRNMEERYRRMQMKDHITRLTSLIHPQPPSKASVSEVLGQATTYIKQLKERLEVLKRRKIELGGKTSDGDNNRVTSGSGSPLLSIRFSESTLEINLISGSQNKSFTLCQIISILEEEGAQVISASKHNAGDSTIYIIQSQAICARIGIETSRVQSRLRELVF